MAFCYFFSRSFVVVMEKVTADFSAVYSFILYLIPIHTNYPDNIHYPAG